MKERMSSIPDSSLQGFQHGGDGWVGGDGWEVGRQHSECNDVGLTAKLKLMAS